MCIIICIIWLDRVSVLVIAEPRCGHLWRLEVLVKLKISDHQCKDDFTITKALPPSRNLNEVRIEDSQYVMKIPYFFIVVLTVSTIVVLLTVSRILWILVEFWASMLQLVVSTYIVMNAFSKSLNISSNFSLRSNHKHNSTIFHWFILSTSTKGFQNFQ